MDFNAPGPYLIALLISVLAYFLKDAHTSIKASIGRIEIEKANQAELERLSREWREDVKNDRVRHQKEMERLERHYEEKFASAIRGIHNQISELKVDMKDRMDMLRTLLEKRDE